MAFALTSLGSVADTTARSQQTCSIFRAPTANALILVSVLVSDTAGTPAEPSSLSGAGLIFSIVGSSVTYNTIASAVHNLSLWRGMGSASIVSSVVTATFANANTGCAMQVTEITGVEPSGTSGAGAVGQSGTSRVDASSAITFLLPVAGQAGNAWFSINGSGNANGPLAQNTWTQIDEAKYTTPITTLESAWTTLSTATIIQWVGGTNERALVAVELVAPSSAVVDTSFYRQSSQGVYFA